MRKVIILLMVLFAVGELYAQGLQTAEARNVSVQEFKLAMDSLSDEVIIDLRTPEELRQGKIPGAMVIDFFGPDFEPAIEALDRNKVYLLYCASGGRSGETAELMRERGFKTLYNLDGGFTAWMKKKMPVSR